MTRKSSKIEPLSPQQAAEVQALEALPDEQTDTSDFPEAPDWSSGSRGKFHRPIKQQITLRLDADVIEWFKGSPPARRAYKTSINRILRDQMCLNLLRSC